jgi:hypothetical protein
MYSRVIAKIAMDASYSEFYARQIQKAKHPGCGIIVG